ncbi:hypothetical protein A3H80_00140 [Candidatus Roizmanbacteria bacterium RIFCSPLOWO2_02_FULL_37_19]|uniref:Glycosyltransferase RgtA/B/C/D-like domain-containing protein n=1 Tax=Candidatus Roizmanbacteria bacterium RIFCSPHIGHO2_02_FULL_37_24 TaxID=1802037 RepID=A0A1F7GV53_9BACT|nr:MAG: hypothetical protein A2862_03530 [Candidatus Roizmanbacteria bacterium RIFCSPHIGHO2_01_FULL_38_41]OGK22868.1 MAG: hypothetical protein A3C24_05015 [Candidatus Roizmanbacteria bacterium RIFCSPHIGHO2_02_FULL_37_24]OGK45342.1 MAG: hypothetical protein A2956_03330 [Candidatus Roizmanbacteria bacterium RIFCSPLOWO2_01_FULL_37_57]OGK53934.1 MAG: hypothetical protein A3H80_00140 [Candidatus Roizmanbacteria bacterium RIFCSPLOWO2_02_FULL_37_19]OGK61827.1 MAG: hypothetical protein A3G65_04170 [Can
MDKKSILWAIVVLIISVVIIFYKFNQIPADLTRDEVEFTRLALSLSGEPYAPYSPLATGHSTLYFYLILASFKLFGVTSFALRLPSALFGILSPVVFYAIIKQIFPKKFSILSANWRTHISIPLALLLVFLLVTQRWYFNFARFSFEVTFLLFLELVSLWFLLIYFKSKNYKYALGSGVFAGLAYNSYIVGRLFFVLPLIFFIYEILNRGSSDLIGVQDDKKKKRLHLLIFKGLLAFLLPFILLTSPLNLYLTQNKDIRIHQQSYFNNTELNFQTKMQFLGQNLASIPLMLFVPDKGDVTGLHNYPYKPALNPIIGVLFLSGLCISISRFFQHRGLEIRTRKRYIAFFFVWFMFSLIPTILTYPWENPNMLRTYTSLVPIIFFSGITIDYAYQLVQRKKLSTYFGIILIGLVCVSAWYELRTYYVFQTEVFKEAFEIKDQLRGVEAEYIRKLDSESSSE